MPRRRRRHRRNSDHGQAVLHNARTPQPPATGRADAVHWPARRCRGKRVLDIGCLDETALKKRDTEEWLHRQIGLVAQQVIGVDLSDQLPDEGLVTGPHSRIVKGDGTDPDVAPEMVDIIIAGEFIEHIPNPLDFLTTMRTRYPGREMLLSTPNGTSFANAVLGAIGREAQHRDHLMTSTYKTLTTRQPAVWLPRLGNHSLSLLCYRNAATDLRRQADCRARRRSAHSRL